MTNRSRHEPLGSASQPMNIESTPSIRLCDRQLDQRHHPLVFSDLREIRLRLQAVCSLSCSLIGRNLLGDAGETASGEICATWWLGRNRQPSISREYDDCHQQQTKTASAHVAQDEQPGGGFVGSHTRACKPDRQADTAHSGWLESAVVCEGTYHPLHCKRQNFDQTRCADARSAWRWHSGYNRLLVVEPLGCDIVSHSWECHFFFTTAKLWWDRHSASEVAPRTVASHR